jgi:DNA-binding NtrC family response regulator
VLDLQGYRCRTFTRAADALAELARDQPALVITDLKMPEMDGEALLRRVRESGRPVPVVVVTAFASIETAVRTVKEGAFDYIMKPFSNEQLVRVVERALRECRLVEENRRLRTEVEKWKGFDRLIGHSPAMQVVFQLVRRAAPTEAGVLIRGASGTGKELVARALHMNSRRAAGPFVPVDCASLPENLLEAELFGHEKGAYTDAHQAKMGLVESADGGTLFLDEIGDMPLGLQAKLLRVLQEKEIRRLGSNRMAPVDIRVIAATHRPVDQMALDGRFREDLYYRLNVIGVSLPRLCERGDDLPVLARYFVRHYARANGRNIEGFDPAAFRLMERYTWPGNVRELQNAIERAVVLAEGPLITVGDLPDSVRSVERSADRPGTAP